MAASATWLLVMCCSPMATSRPGIFAVGDVRSGSVKRVAAAIGEGSVAVRLAFERLQSEGTADPIGLAAAKRGGVGACSGGGRPGIRSFA
jgi:hypothetical protein